jgi:cellulose synthase/poly-beta-1,6-N-acetylglucosamine synthase-like glycosyltransferase
VDEWKTEGIGPVFPRIRAFDLASNEVCACIDGDSVAEPDWLEKVTAPLANPGVSGVGGTVRFFGDLFGNLASLWFFDIGKFRPRFHFYFWGANFACKKSAYRKMGGLEPFISIRYRLGLHFWAEDCYLSLALERVGKIIYQSDAAVCAYPGTAPNTIDRGWKQEADRKALFRFFSETASALDF